MNYRLLAILSFIISCNGMAEAINGACTREGLGGPLSLISCRTPNCLSHDCIVPTIEKQNATLDYSEPTFVWSELCQGIRKGCWTMTISFTFRLMASDPSGIQEVGFELRSETENQRGFNFEKYFGAATLKDSSGRYVTKHRLVLQLAPNKQIDFTVTELCARDNLGNEGCVVPIGNNALMRKEDEPT